MPEFVVPTATVLAKVSEVSEPTLFPSDAPDPTYVGVVAKAKTGMKVVNAASSAASFLIFNSSFATYTIYPLWSVA